MQEFRHARGVMGIYAITHTATGRVYVGSAANVGERWYSHRGCLRRGVHKNARLQAAWAAFGEFAFAFSILERVGSVELLRPREQAWVDVTNAADIEHGYNLFRSVRGHGYRFTDEQRARVSAALKGKKKSPEHVAAMRARAVTEGERLNGRRVGLAGRGVPKSAEHRRKIGEAQRGADNHGAKLSAADVIEIRRLVALGGLTKRAIAGRFGICESTVRKIETGQSWRHLT